MHINDNEAAVSAPAISAEAHGHAALLLVESLMHGLCECSVLSAGHAAEIVERALSVEVDQAEVAAADAGAGAALWQSHAMLEHIASSFRIDEDAAAPPTG